MKYNELNDNELLFLVYEMDDDAKSVLIKKYTGIVYKIASKYTSLALSLGIEEKDLIQEGFIGLNRAIDNYDVNKNVLFYTYVTICIDSNIKTALKVASKKRNISLNSSISLEALEETQQINISEIVKDELSDPSLKLIDRENLEEILKKAENLLTSFEFKVFKYKVDGYSNEEIAFHTKKNKKSIENTLFRIKQKLKK